MPLKKPHVTALILAAGSGQRFGDKTTPKQYQYLLGKPVLRWSVEIFLKHPQISEVVVAINPAHYDLYEQAVHGLPLASPLIGGNSRQETVRRALAEIPSEYVLIHDGARPCISTPLISALCAGLAHAPAVVPAIPITDTIKRIRKDSVKHENRDDLFALQTPQAFHLPVIQGLHQTYGDRKVTDDATLCELGGIPIHIIAGDPGNIKITHAEDMVFAAKMLAAEQLSLQHEDSVQTTRKTA